MWWQVRKCVHFISAFITFLFFSRPSILIFWVCSVISASETGATPLFGWFIKPRANPRVWVSVTLCEICTVHTIHLGHLKKTNWIHPRGAIITNRDLLVLWYPTFFHSLCSIWSNTNINSNSNTCMLGSVGQATSHVFLLTWSAWRIKLHIFYMVRLLYRHTFKAFKWWR